MICSQCDECYEDDDYMYCSKYKKYVNTYVSCNINKKIEKERIEND